MTRKSPPSAADREATNKAALVQALQEYAGIILGGARRRDVKHMQLLLHQLGGLEAVQGHLGRNAEAVNQVMSRWDDLWDGKLL